MIWLDFILEFYDADRVMLFREKGELLGGTIRPKEMKNILFSCTTQAGASSHWSEIAQITTLDHLLTSGNIRFSQYLERIPDGYISKREELLEEVKQEEIAKETQVDFPAQA